MESKNRYIKKLYSTLANCTTIQRTPSQGIVSRDFPIFEGMEKFYCRHSDKQCMKYSFESILTAEPIYKQSAVYVSQPPIASKPGSSPPDRHGLDNITSQPWSDANCHRRTSDSADFPFVTLFYSKTTRHSTKSGGTGASWVRPWLTRDIV